MNDISKYCNGSMDVYVLNSPNYRCQCSRKYKFKLQFKTSQNTILNKLKRRT